MDVDVVCARLFAEADRVREIELALSAGFKNKDWIDKDPDLASIRHDPRFRQLMDS